MTQTDEPQMQCLSCSQQGSVKNNPAHNTQRQKDTARAYAWGTSEVQRKQQQQKKRNDKLCYSVSKTLAEKELCSQEIDSAIILLQEFVILGG